MSLERGIELFNAGRYWDAHEAWEEAWMPDRNGPDGGFYKGLIQVAAGCLDRNGPDGGFYKGLIQVAAGCLHYGRRNRRGTLNKWRSGADYLRPYLPRHHGLDLAALVAQTDANRAAVEAGGWPALAMPVIRHQG